MPAFDTLTADMVLRAVYAAPLLVAALWDLRHFRIPNVLTALMALAFVPAALLAPQPVDWLAHVGAGAAVFAAGAVLFALRMLGGGDVKLAAAVALWLGSATLPFLAVMAVAGGVLALGLLAGRRLLAGVLALTVRTPERVTLPRILLQGEGIPYGLAIAFGGLVVAAQLPLVAQ